MQTVAAAYAVLDLCDRRSCGGESDDERASGHSSDAGRSARK